MNLVARLWILFFATLSCGAPFAAAKTKPVAPSPQQTEEYTRLQIFLDNANFGPGKIDGHDGTFTRKALALYRKAHGEPEPATPADPKAPPVTAGLDLQSIQPVFSEYEITKEDLATVGSLPSGPAAQSKVKTLPYATLAEAMAEKFHCDLGFLKQLNKGKMDHLRAGAKLSVPNVKPFEIAEVKLLQPGSEAANLAANDLDDTAPAEAKGAEPAQEGAPVEPSIAVRVSIAESVAEVTVDQRLVAAFPVTVGSVETKSPVGNWKVRAVAKLPTFRYDQKMLKEGERSANFKMLPPGPNNPVGIMWISLNKKGIGLHGTNDPDSIGRSASHGCIRLADWDVVKLAQLVKAGVPVTIE